MAGTVQYTIGAEASCSDGPCGEVTRVLVDPASGQRGRKEAAIPVSAVASTSDGIRLRISKQQVQDLPPVDVDHPGASTSDEEGSR
jgi:hypothetical protein